LVSFISLQYIMELSTTHISGLLIIKPSVFGDERGHFFESYRQDTLLAAGVELDFVQDNQSLSGKGILRGLHFQKNPYAQGKLVRVIKGAVLDIAVDIRRNSKTYGEHFSIALNEEDKTMLYVPPGFAHGFVTQDEDTIFAYKCTNYYHKESEGAILWNSPSLGIDWGISEPIISAKDTEAEDFLSFESPF
jgi:dTDP-4-dehydrorhamnose 3,5-epimerase